MAFRFIALIITPLILFAVLEGGLRVGGYGYDTAFFKKLRIGNSDYLVNNDDFVRRFFPPQLTRLPGVLRMEATKPLGVTRIFIFGESAALGDPNPAYAASRYMGAMLAERFPGHRFEIVNTGITAINSHTILPIARECAKHDGDFWIVYMGNNEMVGPFGAASVFGAQAPPRWIVRTGLALQKLRLGQLLTAMIRSLKWKSSSPAAWSGMEMFLGNQIPPNDPRKETVYRNFQENLCDIVRAGLDSGASVILNTVAVNLKDCSPFGAGSNATSSAESEYRNAQALLASNNFPADRTEFQKACDDDTLPFRADSRINSIIHDAATEFAGPNLRFCDATAPTTLGEADTNIFGDEFFLEHVHLNFHGNYRLGLAWAENIEGLLPPEIRNSAINAWASEELCDRRLGLSDWNRVIVASELIRRRQKAPLSGQSNNAQELEKLGRELNALRRRMNAADGADARAMFIEDIQHNPDDYLLRFGYGDFLEGIGDAAEALKNWRQVEELLPQYYLVYLQEGRMLEQERQLDDAHTAFQRAVSLYPRMTVAWFEMSNIDASQGKYDASLGECENAVKLEPGQPVLWACLGRILSKMNRHTEAIEKYRQSILINSNYFDGRLALAEELTVAGQTRQATNEFIAAIKLQPASAQAHLEFGEALLKMNDRSGARQQFQETLRIDPHNDLARKQLENFK
jgi:tetratricopeptide (TPR) repeat protein